MVERKRLLFALMDPPFESSRVSLAMRLMDAAARQGHHLVVFAYEGAVFLPFALQKAHANSIHGHDEKEEQHPLTREWIAELQNETVRQGGSLEWINCGLCIDERGAGECIAGIKRGSPADFVKWIENSDNAVVIPTH